MKGYAGKDRPAGIPSCGCSVAPYVKPGILKLLVPLTEEYGSYPLQDAAKTGGKEYVLQAL